ncbi:MAG: gluconate 2-dehydrogenase subunit 3 family protein [Nitrospirales bacterium]
MNRRAFMKKAVYFGAGLIAVAGFGVGGKLFQRTSVQPAVPLGLPTGKAGSAEAGSRWFTPAELATMKALASVIIPSDGNGPGATEADLAGQLERFVADTPRRQDLYRTGLAAFDGLAMQQHQQAFATLGMKEQIELFSMVDQARLVREEKPVSIQDKATRKLRILYYFRWRGVSSPATEFCQYLVPDAKAKFYSSQVAWAWLEYEGPPFPLGYFSSVDKCAIPMV